MFYCKRFLMVKRAGKKCGRCWLILILAIFSLIMLSPGYQPSTQREALVPGWEYNVSRNTEHYILPNNTTTIVNVNDLCPPRLLLVVIVCSAPSNFEQRHAIRETWGTLSDDSTKIAFLLGETDNTTVQATILEESTSFEDIIQEAFFDSYNNLTIKSVMMLKWVQHHCSSAHFLMKVDDDVYLNLPVLVEALSLAPTANTLIGSLICKAKPIQDSTNKWYMPQYIFYEEFYPNYLSGTGYLMSQDVVAKLFKTTLHTPIVHLEDVYITGICARVAGIRPVNSNGFFYQRRRIADSCSPSVFTNHRMSPEDLHNAFSYVGNCSITLSSTVLPSLIVDPRSKSAAHCR